MACCFLADGFLDDFGERATREYLERLGVLLTKGWFEVRTDRERLFYVIAARLFAERDVLDPTVRQAILRLYRAERQDVELRLDRGDRGRGRLETLKRCAESQRPRDPRPLGVPAAPAPPGLPDADLRGGGADLVHRRPRRLLRRPQARPRHVHEPVAAGRAHAAALPWPGISGGCAADLPRSGGRDLLIAFLTRDYLHAGREARRERIRGGLDWAVYE